MHDFESILNDKKILGNKLYDYIVVESKISIILTQLPNYLNPSLPENLSTYRIPIVEATPESTKGYGWLVDDPDQCEIEISRWPASGWRPVDLDSGNEGGTKEGIFSSEWKGDILYGKNEAVGGHYLLGYSNLPELSFEDTSTSPQRILIWHANYHPDGGQLFFPLDPMP